MKSVSAAYRNVGQNKIGLMLAAIIGCILVTTGLDFLEAQLQNSSFYLSESLLFSSFWWLFLPLLYLQLKYVKRAKEDTHLLLLIFIPPMLHLIAFPALVYVLSSIIYYHTFSYWGTFQFGITTYFFTVLILYSLPIIALTFFRSRSLSGQNNPESQTQSKPYSVSSFVVADGYKRVHIETKDILYFSANPPYTTIHHKTKNYLYSATLKSILANADSRLFVRIHKSVIVNCGQVQSYTSRHNGDYDLTMNDGTVVRLSRNYAKDFKSRFETHRDNV